MGWKALGLCAGLVAGLCCIAVAQSAPTLEEFKRAQQAWQLNAEAWAAADVVFLCVYEESRWGFQNQPDRRTSRRMVIQRQGDRRLLWDPQTRRLLVSTPALEFAIHDDAQDSGAQDSQVWLAGDGGVERLATSGWLLDSIEHEPAPPDVDFQMEALDQIWQFQSLAQEYWVDKIVSPAGPDTSTVEGLVRFEFVGSSPEHPIRGTVIADRSHGYRLVEISQTVTSSSTGDTLTDTLRLDYLVDHATETRFRFDWTSHGESATRGQRGISKVGEVRRWKSHVRPEQFELARYGLEMRPLKGNGVGPWAWWVAGLALLAAAVLRIIARVARR